MSPDDEKGRSEPEQSSPEYTGNDSARPRGRGPRSTKPHVLHVPAAKFKVLYTFLYCIYYTGRITLRTCLSFKQADMTLPDICDAQEVHEMAHLLSLEQVKTTVF
jgi:hypothetical protein